MNADTLLIDGGTYQMPKYQDTQAMRATIKPGDNVLFLRWDGLQGMGVVTGEIMGTDHKKNDKPLGSPIPQFGRYATVQTHTGPVFCAIGSMYKVGFLQRHNPYKINDLRTLDSLALLAEYRKYEGWTYRKIDLQDYRRNRDAGMPPACAYFHAKVQAYRVR
jgi:hypothetical protein